jgi:hypothetical protein
VHRGKRKMKNGTKKSVFRAEKNKKKSLFQDWKIEMKGKKQLEKIKNIDELPFGLGT